MGLLECGFPEEKLPQCWSDDVRMNALFAPFRLKSANPESWEMKMKFWSDMVRQWCRHKMDPIVSAADIKCAFQRKGRTAACIDIVIEEMYKNGDLSPISKYIQILHNGPEGWVKWGARLAFKPAAIALTALTSLLPTREVIDSNGLPKATIDSTQRFVLESAVKDQATNFLYNYPPGVERLGTIEELMKITNFGNRETLEILLGYLVSQGSAVKKGDVVKLAEPNKRVSDITAIDEALVKMVSAETRLSADAERLARDVSNAAAEASAAMKLGNKIAAKNHLRRKLKAQQRLDRCEAALDNVRQLLVQARNTDMNATVIDTYRTSAQAMKVTMKDGNLEEDAVHDTMDDLKEVMDSYNEVEKALSGSVDEFDAAELEQELAELLSGPGGSGGTPGKAEFAEPDRGAKLPSPPSQRPGRKTEEFFFDGEEQMLAELNKLDVEDAGPGKKIAVPIAEEVPTPERKKNKPSQQWYPPPENSLKPQSAWPSDHLDKSLQAIGKDYGELRQDDRLHPGQPLNVDFSVPPRHYSRDFQVQDHKPEAGVWIYNSRDGRYMTAGTDYNSSESPEQHDGQFQMAPGGERPQTDHWPAEDSVEDLERRLKNLRGFNNKN